jgi:hypothetical protein
MKIVRTTKPLARAALGLSALLGFVSSTTQAQMTVSSLNGPVTQTEANSYKTWLATQTPIKDNTGDNLAHHTGAQGIDSIGLMYEVTGDQALLDTYVKWTDAIIAGRDDQVNGLHAIAWTGKVEPIWSVGKNADGTAVASTNGEQGLVMEHALYCAVLILRNPAIWSTTVPSGDPFGFGATYKQRALKYVAMCDQSYASFLIKWFQTNGQWRFPAQSTGYNGSTWYGSPLPWNQQMMENMGLIRLVDCHLILGDNPTLVSQYNTIVQTSVSWFLNTGVTAATYQSHPGYWWGYVIERADHTTVEDTGHGDFDLWGLFMAYETGRYGISDAVMTKFANNLHYAIYTGSVFNQNVDGTNASTQTNLQMHWMPLEKFDPAMYAIIGNADLSNAASTGVYFGRLMWEKNQRYQAFSVDSMTGPRTVAAGGSTSYTLLVSPLGGARGTVNLSVSGAPTGVTATLSPASVNLTTSTGATSTLNVTTTTTTTAAGTYTLTITGSNGTVSHPETVTLTVSKPTAVTLEAESLAYTTSGQTVTTGADTNASGGVVAYLNATGTAQYVEFTTTSLPAGTYQLQFRYKRNTSRGQHTIKIDGTQVGGTIDEYATTSGYTTVTAGTVTYATAGTHKLRLTVTGKNAASGSYVLAPDCFTFVGQ